MPEHAPTHIGRVRRVLGAQVTVELDPNLAGVAPVFRGQLQAIGQIGSLVRIPQGMVDLIATVTLVGIAELAGVQPPTEMLHSGERWLQVQLLGEIDKGTGRFQRGVGSYPGLDDSVHFALMEELEAVFPSQGAQHLRIGQLSASSQVPIALDTEKFVVRHSAVIGSTGAGKTSAVASILQGFSNGGWPSANIIVIDTHGEYAHALGDQASVRSVLGTGNNQLQVPYWALPANDILTAFTNVTIGSTTTKTFNTLVAEARRRFLEECVWLKLDAATVTADTPIPFDIYDVWHRLDSENRETRTNKGDASTACIINPGDAAKLIPATFEPYNPAGQSPHQAPTYNVHGRIPELLRLGLQDPRLAFLRGPEGTVGGNDPLESSMQQWLGHTSPISVLDFNGVPPYSAELAIGVILHLLFETAIRTTADEPGIGRARPVLIVLEEAHRYLGDAAASMVKLAVNRIAREGRKYGIGLMLVTQRPSELPDTALSQCGTLIALRLTNSSDQAKIRHALPDNVAGLAEALPSLRTGEAIIAGEALVLPARTIIDRPSPLPLAEDPTLDSWRLTSTTPHISPALARWRGTPENTENEGAPK
ncbi:ATP-binding protein [Rhodococcus sp. C3V]|uniref:ATP-binding protein n=1 Tax=Rhodococcus sp. C3V TaxID=3034165 RepID=UPI0023E209A8|nr:ATP-binding protein [Rhodococcus sp. C3V]MDF3319900.1 ATP-binding protein [Rhodococcus sp. C3V]